MAGAAAGRPQHWRWHTPTGVDTSWNKLSCPYQAYTPTNRCRHKTELVFLPKVAQRHGEL